MDLLSEEQIAECKEAFTLFDKDQDGVLQIKDLGELMKQLWKQGSEEELKDLIDEMDNDGYGQIEFTEFLELMAGLYREDAEDQQQEAFRIIDKDANGMISGEEIRFLLTKLGDNISDEEIDGMIRQASKHGENQLEDVEFLELVKLS